MVSPNQAGPTKSTTRPINIRIAVVIQRHGGARRLGGCGALVTPERLSPTRSPGGADSGSGAAGADSGTYPYRVPRGHRPHRRAWDTRDGRVHTEPSFLVGYGCEPTR